MPRTCRCCPSSGSGGLKTTLSVFECWSRVCKELFFCCCFSLFHQEACSDWRPFGPVCRTAWALKPKLWPFEGTIWISIGSKKHSHSRVRRFSKWTLAVLKAFQGLGRRWWAQWSRANHCSSCYLRKASWRCTGFRGLSRYSHESRKLRTMTRTL